jgi:hypothetical protein
MTIGRPHQPLELKRLKGTLRADRLPPTAPLIPLANQMENPEPEASLREAGRAFWIQAWIAPWLSHGSDYWLVLITAQALDEREAVRTLLAASPTDRKLRTTIRELDKQVINSYSLLGFTPSDRSRLGVAEVKKESKLEELIRRKSERFESQNDSQNQ